MRVPVPRRDAQDRPVYECKQCGAQFGTYPKAERHIDETHGNGRISTLLALKDPQ
jgi:hypothetical protein